MALDHRIEQFKATGDPSTGLDPQAPADAHQLTELDDGDLEIVYTLGMFYHSRVIASARQGTGAPESPDSSAAMTYFRTLYFEAPDLLPEGLFDGMVEVWPVTEAMLATWS